MDRSFIPKLFRTAMITSPLMGLFSFTQMYIIIQGFNAVNPELVRLSEFNTWRIFGAMVAIMAISLVFWFANIGLVYWEKMKTWNIHPNWRYFFSFVLVMGIALIVQSYGSDHRPIQTKYSFLIPFLGSITINSFILVLIDLITAQSKKAQLELDKAYLEVSNLVASQKHLKNQIHPHFLFNALATLQILITTAPDQAKAYLVRLSSFLRSSISTTDKDVVSIADELAVLTDYMELQRVRFQEGVSYSIAIPETVRNQGYLPVFTLQMLAENAIQHNGFNEHKRMDICLRYENNGSLTFSNTLIPKYSPKPSTGIGLSNLSKRFELLGAAPPVVSKDDKVFKVSLQVLREETAISWM